MQDKVRHLQDEDAEKFRELMDLRSQLTSVQDADAHHMREVAAAGVAVFEAVRRAGGGMRETVEAVGKSACAVELLVGDAGGATVGVTGELGAPGEFGESGKLGGGVAHRGR